VPVFEQNHYWVLVVGFYGVTIGSVYELEHIKTWRVYDIQVKRVMNLLSE
jgi:hypothetical protein